MRRVACVLILMGVSLVAAAAPASAHTVAGTGATDFKTTLIGLSPPAPGLSVRVIDRGARLQLSNTGPEIIVRGYAGEPYLRVGPNGVFENENSPATYQNVGTTGIPVPSHARPDAVPDWRTISSGHTARWHDHRIHWGGGKLPSFITATPGTTHLVRVWRVPLAQGQQSLVILGTLTWIPGPSPWPWVVLALAALAATVLAVRTRVWASGLAVAMALLIASDIVHVLGVGFAITGTLGHQLILILASSYYSIIAWVVGLFAVRLLAGENIDGIFPATFTGLLIGVFGGVSDAGVLYRSQAAFAWAATLERIVVAIAIGCGLGTVIGAVLAFRDRRPTPEQQADHRRHQGRLASTGVGEPSTSA